jgi:hypothetical protein
MDESKVCTDAPSHNSEDSTRDHHLNESFDNSLHAF